MDSLVISTFKEGIIQSLYNLFQRLETEGTLPDSSYEDSVT